MKRSLIALVALCGCASEPGATSSSGEPGLHASPIAAETSARPRIDPDVALTVDDCVRLAESSSLTARSFEARLKAARGTADAAAVWPNPTIEYMAEDVGLVAGKRRQL